MKKTYIFLVFRQVFSGRLCSDAERISIMGRIRILEQSVALKIAAGEVIDRPSSILRELLDNSIDAGSSVITVNIESSGMKEIRVTDNGSGMDRDDLELCFLPHATSKISSAEDLYSINTLGFRGEALSSIASSARLEIITSTDSDSAGHSLKTDSSGKFQISTVKARKGTIISAKDLFYAFPARKQFLKSPSAETTLCRNIFFEKAAARPDISFRLYIDGKLVQMLPVSSLKERIHMSYGAVFQDPALLYEAYEPAGTDNSYSIKAVLADPVLYRKDRKYIHIYLNGRRIQEYSLIQAAVYGYSEYLPGGHFPAAVIFIDNKPDLVDFNIHPAKREAKIKNIKQIHHSVTGLIVKTLKENSASAGKTEFSFKSSEENLFRNNFNEKKVSGNTKIGSDKDLSVRRNDTAEDSEFYVAEKTYTGFPSAAFNLKKEITGNANFKYLGQIFNTFILCEMDDALYIIDQHAAHEKSIYESFSGKKHIMQKLLVPLYFPDSMEFSKVMVSEYKKTGIIIEMDESGSWFIDALPEILSCIKNDIVSIIMEFPGNINEVRKKLYATASCKKAVKGGDVLSREEAETIIKAAFNLETPYCPHGRPVWQTITRKELLAQINRIV